jgi:glycogen synthase kinase 3 beta
MLSQTEKETHISICPSLVFTGLSPSLLPPPNPVPRSPSLRQVFRSKATPEAVDLMSKLLVYTPDRRLTPLQACAHQFFDELRDPNTRYLTPSNP